MNSRKTNSILIENITVQVPNTASINKSILFVSWRKWSFNLRLKLWSEFANSRSVGKLFQTIGVRYDNFFWPEHVFLKGCFRFKTEDLVFAWFWPDCLYISWKYRGQVSLKNLFFSKCFTPVWLLLRNTSVLGSLQFTFQFLIQIWTPSWAGIIRMWSN